jgi:hypothetical protein
MVVLEVAAAINLNMWIPLNWISEEQPRSPPYVPAIAVNTADEGVFARELLGAFVNTQTISVLF